MDKGLPADAFVPVPLRWRHVALGDVIVGRVGGLWLVTALPGARSGVTVQADGDPFTAPVDPDEVVNVLVPVTERDAVELTREQLGARLIERRTA